MRSLFTALIAAVGLSLVTPLPAAATPFKGPALSDLASPATATPVHYRYRSYGYRHYYRPYYGPSVYFSIGPSYRYRHWRSYH
jgi:hypothetical protein